jgi:hypothetical protein
MILNVFVETHVMRLFFCCHSERSEESMYMTLVEKNILNQSTLLTK